MTTPNGIPCASSPSAPDTPSGEPIASGAASTEAPRVSSRYAGGDRGADDPLGDGYGDFLLDEMRKENARLLAELRFYRSASPARMSGDAQGGR